MVTPGGGNRVKVELGSDDDIIRLPNKTRSGDACKPLPKLSPDVYVLRRTAQAATASFLHDVFNHSSAEKVYQTLGATKGHTQIRPGDLDCDTFARAKARSFGLSRKHAQQSSAVGLVDGHDEGGADEVLHIPTEELLALLAVVVQAGEAAVVASVFEPDSDPGDEADREFELDSEYVAPAAGRELGVQSVPRADLYKLKTVELMFVDNKDCAFPARGGATSTLVFVDYKTRVKLFLVILDFYTGPTPALHPP